MAGYTESGSITIDGLGNGTEFADMIAALKKIEMKHANQLANWRNDWEKRLDAFGQLRTALTEFSSFMKTMNSEDKFLVKSVGYSNSNVCTVTNSIGAVDGVYKLDVKTLATNSYATIETNCATVLDKVSSAAGNFQYTYGDPPTTHTVAVGADTTLQGLVNMINTDQGNPGVSASIMQTGGKIYLQLQSKETGAGTDIGIPTANPGTGEDLSGLDAFAGQNWVSEVGKNAEFKMNGFPPDPQNFVSSSNSVSVYGMDINFNSANETTITVGTDTKAIKANVEKFVEEINKVRGLLVSLTSVNEDKVQKDPDYATSQFDMQMGSVLTGNYGVQLLKSMFNTSTISQAAGFEYLFIDESAGTFTGDIYSSLAQIGIKTDHQLGSPTFGQLIFEDNESLITLDKALADSPAGVAELFSAKKKTYADSSSFTIMDEYCMMDWVKAGKYDVEYDTGPGGEILEVRINGQKAKELSSGLYSLSDASNKEFGGLAIMINDTTPNSTLGGVARVKDGKLNELIDLVDQDFLRAYNVMDKEKNGTLSILEEQYKAIITNIEKKIMQEDERIIKWERTTKLRFSRLEAVLKKYDGLQQQLDTQLKQLSSGKD